jgi:hypothetical protein
VYYFTNVVPRIGLLLLSLESCFHMVSLLLLLLVVVVVVLLLEEYEVLLLLLLLLFVVVLLGLLEVLPGPLIRIVPL